MTTSPQVSREDESRHLDSRDMSERRLPEKHRSNVSNQLLLDLGYMLKESGQELNQRLEENTFERQNAHSAALDAAIHEHERVRLAAERAQSLYQLRLRTEQKSREIAELREFDRVRQQEIENEINEQIKGYNLLKRIEQENEEATRKVQNLKQAQLRLREQQSKAQAVKDEDVEVISGRPESDNKDSLSKTSPPPPQSQGVSDRTAINPVISQPAQQLPTPQQPGAPTFVNGRSHEQLPASSIRVSIAQRELEHKRYLDLHAELKTLREYMILEAKKDPRLKQEMGNMRRDIKKSVGQLTVGKGANEIPVCYPETPY